LQSSADDGFRGAKADTAFKCSESSPELQKLADKFTQLLGAGVYPETFLVGVSVLIHELTSLCGNDSECIRCSLTVILCKDQIRRVIETLKGSEEKISSLIDSNPVFEVLKPYKQLIIDIITRSPQQQQAISQIPITAIREDRGGRVVLQTSHLSGMLEPYIERLEFELSYARSVEWYLIKLSSLVMELKDLCFLQSSLGISESTCVEDLLKTALNNERIKRHMAQLKNNTEVFLESIDHDPRFRNLKPYRALLSSYLASLPPPPPRREKPPGTAKLYELEEEEELYVPVYKSEKPTHTTYKHFEPEEIRPVEYSVRHDTTKSGVSEHKAKPTKVFPKALVAILTMIILAVLLYIVHPIQHFTEFFSQWSAPIASITTATPITSNPDITSPYIRSMWTASTPTSLQREVQTSTTLQSHQTLNRLTTASYTQTTLFTSSLIWSATPSPQPRYRVYIDLGSTKMYVNGTHLVVEEFWSSKPSYPYLTIQSDEYTLHLVPYPIGSSTLSVVATYVFANRTYSKAVFSIDEILKALNSSRTSYFEINLLDADEKCTMYVDWSRRSISFGDCKGVLFLLLPSLMGSTNTFYDVILGSFNESTLSFLRELVYGNTTPRDVRDATWRALEWVDRNVKYDHLKAISISSRIYDPIEFAEKRSGVCADYAVFLAATLISANVEHLYILSLNTTEGPHATVAVEINGTLFVLDQHLPAVEWNDYVEYVFGVRNPIYVYKIMYDPEKGSTIEFYKLSALNYTDTYPSDAVPASLAQDVCKKLASVLGATCTSTCRSIYSWSMQWRWEVLKRYSPVFHEQWVDYIAGKLTQYFKQRPSCIWIEVSGPSTLTIYYR